MLSFQACAKVPYRPGPRSFLGDGPRSFVGGGGLVEVESRVVWSGGGGVYMLNEVVNEWTRVADSSEMEATLAVCEGRLIALGGHDNGIGSKTVMELRGGRWSTMPEMLVGCTEPCVVSVSGGGMVVMGGRGEGGKPLNDVQVFDGGTQTWHRGPSFPKPCAAMSAMVHGDLVFVMGGLGMDRAVWCADIRDLTASHTPTHQSIWRQLPDVPYYYSSVSVSDGVLLAIGGAEDRDGSKRISAIHGLHRDDKKWKHIGDLPFACCWVDTLLLSERSLLVVDRLSQQVLKIAVKGLTKLFPITSNVKVADKSQKEAHERFIYGDNVGTVYVQ